ncbi:unnamed protein product [Lota lota]
MLLPGPWKESLWKIRGILMVYLCQYAHLYACQTSSSSLDAPVYLQDQRAPVERPAGVHRSRDGPISSHSTSRGAE